MAETTQTPPLPNELPVVPLRGAVVLPMTVAPLGVSRPISVEAVNKALAGDRMVLLLLQKNDNDDPAPDELHRVGTVAIIRQMAKGQGGMRVLVEGIARARAEFLQTEKGYLTALIKPLPEASERSLEIDAHVRRLQELVDRALSLATGLSPDIRTLVTSLDDPLRVAYLLASLLDMKPEDKQRLLEEDSVSIKLDAVATALAREIDVLELKGQIESRAEKEMTDAQKQYVLRQQMKAIQSELGEGDGEVQELRKRIAEANLPEHVAAVANREVDRLERMTPAAPEYQMIRTYLDWLLEVPWEKRTDDRLDPIEARRVLDEDHYDLDKVKERIVEYLAVRKLKGDMKGPILCFVGPPGRRQDVARPVDRARDEPEVRAHLARRRPRRVGDPRPSPHLHRLDARAPGPGAQDRRLVEPRAHARRDRQDQRRRAGGSGRGAARGARPGAEPRLPRSLPRGAAQPVQRALHRDREPARDDPPGAARSHGDHSAQQLHRGGEGPHREDVPRPAAARGARAEARAADHRRCRAAARDLRVHARSGRPLARAADRRDRAQGGGEGRDRRRRTSGS